MKNGFTLIEMMGIIVVLSVIVLVSLPSIVQTNKNSKKNELAEAEQTIFMAAEVYIETNDSAKKSLKRNNYYYVKLSTLVDEGLLMTNLKNPKTDKKVTEGAWWVEVKLTNGNASYNLVKENPYEKEIEESELVYAVLKETGELKKDSNNKDRYFYVGSNPNNYLEFNNEVWRIVSIEADKTIKIIRNEFLEGSFKIADAFTNMDSSSLITYLNSADNYLKVINDKDEKLIVSHLFNSGSYLMSNPDINVEKSVTINKKVGLLNPSDYINASANEECNISNSVIQTSDPCLADNYLFKNSRWWLMNPADSGVSVISSGRDEVSCADASESQITSQGFNSFPAKCLAKVRPVVYLNENIKILKGTGKISDPYVFG